MVGGREQRAVRPGVVDERVCGRLRNREPQRYAYYRCGVAPSPARPAAPTRSAGELDPLPPSRPAPPVVAAAAPTPPLTPHLSPAASAMLELTTSSKDRKALLERRDGPLRFTPLLSCISGAKHGAGKTNMSGLGQQVAVARLLLEAGARPNAKDVAGFTAFHLAADTGANADSLAIAAMLPAYGGDPNLKNRFGSTSLTEGVSFSPAPPRNAPRR